MKTRILLVDDDEAMVKSSKHALESHGYEVDGEIDAERALEKLKTVSYDLMITELVMLKLDGIRLIRNAKIINPSIGVIVLTGYPSPEAIRHALQVGAIDFLAKPFFPEVLGDVVTKALSYRKTAQIYAAHDEFDMGKINAILQENRNRPERLIPVLQDIQEITGYLPPSIQKLVSRELNVPISKVSGVVTFYFMFTMTPKGKHKIRICTGTACHVKGAEQNFRRVKGYLGMRDDETMTKDKFFSVESVRCVGACSLAPVADFDGTIEGLLTPDEITKKIEETRRGA
ncbi:MAG TPA: NAD(P)H-dependent oxidoreductase subunit E [Thermodesulfovibrionales bacterium]|nr:NAD(P)H-dependent oxidoreductase subunit E [Thermodesulfovibrionales bacterium]